MARVHGSVPSLLALLAALSVASCDNSDSESPGAFLPIAPLVVTGIEPDPFVSYVPTPFTISGSGFLRSTAAQVSVTFRTDDGTPFADGTSAQVQVAGTVISDTEIQGVTPVTNSPGTWASTLEVSDSIGSGASAAPVCEFVGLTVFDIDTPEIPADQATPVEVFGLAFRPQGGSATIRFVSTIPGAFPGGADTLDVPGTIDLTRISGVTPVLSLAAPVPAYVSVVLDQVPGTPQVTSACALTVFEPPPAAPVVVNTITSPLPLGVPTQFTVTGTGFLGAGNPNVAVTFTATAATPLFDGTAVSVSVLGNATSDTTVVGTSPTGWTVSRACPRPRSLSSTRRSRPWTRSRRRCSAPTCPCRSRSAARTCPRRRAPRCASARATAPRSPPARRRPKTWSRTSPRPSRSTACRRWRRARCHSSPR
jgi:hypothetical protein